MGVVVWVRRAAILGVIVFLVTAGLVTASAMWIQRQYPVNQDFEQPFDVVLVLASGIEPDKILSFSSRRRVHGAVYLLSHGHAKRLIFSGGRAHPQHPIVGELMRDFAIELGAEPSALAVEDRSRSTWENFRFSYPLLDQPGVRHIGLLTDPTHLPRSMVLNAYFDGPEMELIAAPGQFKTSRAIRVVEVSREALSWWYNLGKIAAWEVTGWLGYTEEERGKFLY